MKLSLLLLLLLLLLMTSGWAEPVHEYNGFMSCDSDGWFCNPIPGTGGYEIIYDCSHVRKEIHYQTTRIWVWTARLPNKSKKLTVRNCYSVELHVDCTRHERNTAILEFRVVNVHKLVILEPNTGQLHDNLPIPHFPPLFYMENVQETSFYRGLFENEDRSCYYNGGKLEKMILKRVGIKNIPSGSFFNEMEELHWSQVRVDNIEAKSMVINGSITIEDSHFITLPTNAMTFSGKNVIFRRNSIGQILPQAIDVFSSNFELKNNSIEGIMSLGLSVSSSRVNIEGNVIKHLEKEALGGIGPSFYDKRSVYSVSYTFTHNALESLGPFSLHNNWTEYENSCSTVTINNNKFDCSCYNIIWLYGYMKNKTKLPSSGFYKTFLNTTHHCGTTSNCSLSSILPYACQDEESIVVNCAGFQEKENFTFLLNTTELNIETWTEVSQDDFKNLSWDKSRNSDSDILNNSDQQEMILGNTYYKDNGGELSGSKSNFPIWIIVLIFVFLATLNVLAYVMFYLRRRKKIGSIDVCKYEKGDSDTLIINTRSEGTNIECENISYQD